MPLLLKVNLRQFCESHSYGLITWNDVSHCLVVKLLVGIQVKVSCSGESEEYGLLLAGLLTLQCLVYGNAYSVA